MTGETASPTIHPRASPLRSKQKLFSAKCPVFFLAAILIRESEEAVLVSQLDCYLTIAERSAGEEDRLDGYTPKQAATY
jgi:hypothetical protein